MKVLVCGGRDFSDRPFLFAVLDRVHAKRTTTTIVEGGARGADSLARTWAESRGVSVTTVAADWERYRNRAGPVRNCKMMREEKPDFVVAFAGERGTSHMVTISKQADVPVLETWRFVRNGTV